MGKGNPESADVIIARDSDVFVADKLSELNKNQLDSLNVKWVELRSVNGYKKFNNILQDLDIPHTSFTGNIDTKLEEIFKEIVDQ